MRVVGQEQIAALFGVVPKTITEWQVMGFPVAVQGGPGIASEYDAPVCIQWLVDREVRKVQAESPKDRVLRLQGDKLERDMLLQLDRLIPTEQVEPLWASAVLAAREFLLGEPARLATLAMGLDKPALERMLSEAFEEFLGRLAGWRAPENDDDGQPDTEEDGA